jgi:hypothetical protein
MRKILTWLTLPRLLVTILFVAIFTMAVRVPADTDTWWHVRSGQYIVENLTIPTTDPFSHTQAGQLWIDHGWLAQALWYGLYASGGWAAMGLALAVLVTLSFWFIWRQIESNVFIGALSMVLGAIVSSVVWAARPQMISFLLTAVVAFILDQYKRHQSDRILIWIPIIMLFWANIHGGFAIGFIMMLAYVAGEALNNITRHQDDPVVSWSRLKYLGIAIGISLLVVVINPHTWRMWLYPFQTVGIGALRDFIQEWQSPNFHLAHAQPFIVMLVLILVAMARTGQKADWTDLTLVALWMAWALVAARNIAIFGLVTTPILARYADLAWIRQWQVWGYTRIPFSTSGSRQSRRPRSAVYLNWLLLALVIIPALIKIYVPLTPKANLDAEQKNLPYTAIEFLQENRPSGPMFNSYNWGGYLIFKLWPDYPVYIDGRTDLYDDAFIRRYIKVMVADDGWQEVLDEDGINLVLIEKNSTLAKFLRQNAAWLEIYSDEMAAIFIRN